MAKKLKEKKIIVAILCLIVILIILVIALNYIKNVRKEKKVEEQQKLFQEFRTEYESQTILPRHIYELYNYKGYYDTDYLYKNMKKFVDYISYLNKNINLDDIDDFYQEKSQDILSILGIDNKEEFQTFLTKIKLKNVDIDCFNYAEVESGSSYSKNGYFHFVLYLYYDNEPVKFNVAFSEKSKNEVKVAYECTE